MIVLHNSLFYFAFSENHHQKNKVPSGSTVAQLQSSVVTFPLDLDQTIEPREFDENNLNSNKEQSKRRGSFFL